MEETAVTTVIVAEMEMDVEIEEEMDIVSTVETGVAQDPMCTVTGVKENKIAMSQIHA